MACRDIQHIQYYGVVCCLLQLLSINGSDCTEMPLAKVSCYRFTYWYKHIQYKSVVTLSLYENTQLHN